MPSTILYDPNLNAVHTDYKDADEAAISEDASYPGSQMLVPHTAPWRTANANPTNTRALVKLDNDRRSHGRVIQLEHATPLCYVESYAGKVAKMNGVDLEGDDALSGLDLATSADFTSIYVFRVKSEIDPPAGSEYPIAWFGTSIAAVGTYDWAIFYTAADKYLRFRWARYTAAQTYTSTVRVDDGEIHAVAIVGKNSGPTGKAYHRPPGSSVVALTTSQSISAHSSQTAQRIAIGSNNGSVVSNIELFRGWHIQRELTRSEIEAAIDQMTGLESSASVYNAWQMAAGDTGTTTVTDDVGTSNLTVPNVWVTRLNPWASHRWSGPLYGPITRRYALSFSADGSSEAGPATPNGLIPESYSIVGIFRAPKTPHPYSVVLWYGNTWLTRDVSLEINNDLLLLRVQRVGGSTVDQAATNDHLDGEWHKFLITIDHSASEGVLTVDGVVEATCSAIPSHTAATNAQLALGSRTLAGGDESRVDIMGPVGVRTGLMTWSEAEDILENGSPYEFDPRWHVVYPLNNDLTDRGQEGSGTMDLVLGTGVSWIEGQFAPISGFDRQINPAPGSPQTLVIAESSPAQVSEHAIHVWDASNPTNALTVRSARLFDGTVLELSGIEPSFGRLEGPTRSKVSFYAYLTREQGLMLLDLASKGAEVAIATPVSEDFIGNRLESAGPGRIVSARELPHDLVKYGGSDYRYKYKLTVETDK